jgi:hypothetical protein
LPEIKILCCDASKKIMKNEFGKIENDV